MQKQNEKLPDAAIAQKDQEPLMSAGRSAVLALLLLVPAPTLGLLAALSFNPAPMGRGLFMVSKVWLLVLPAVWVRWVDREPWRWPRAPREGWGVGVGSGLAIGLGILAAYGLLGRHWIDVPHVHKVAEAAGLRQPAVYLAAAAYWCFVNALLEEYVWRWFVVGKCRVLMGPAAAVVAGSLCFTLHHVLALHAYFDARIAVLGSLGVFIGGVVWSLCYLRYRSIWPGYVSHIGADLAVFAIGYWLFFLA